MEKKNYIVLLFFVTIFFSCHQTNTMSYIKNAWSAVSNATQKSWNWIRGKKDESAEISQKKFDQETKLKNQLISTPPSEITTGSPSSTKKKQFLTIQEKNDYLEKNKKQIIKKLKKNFKKNRHNQSGKIEIEVKHDIEKLKKIYQAQKKIDKEPKKTPQSFSQFLKQAFSNENHGFNSKKYYYHNQKSKKYSHKKNNNEQSNNIDQKYTFLVFDKNQKTPLSSIKEHKTISEQPPTRQDDEKIMALLLPKKKLSVQSKKSTLKNKKASKIQKLMTKNINLNLQKNENTADFLAGQTLLDGSSLFNLQKDRRIPLVALPKQIK